MNKIIVVLLVLGVVGCAGNMPVHFQQNNPLRTTPNQNQGTPIYTDTQAIIDARVHAQQDYQDGFIKEQLPLFRLQALEGKPQTYQHFYKQEYTKEINFLKTNNMNSMVSSYVVVIAIVVLIVYLTNNQL